MRSHSVEQYGSVDVWIVAAVAGGVPRLGNIRLGQQALAEQDGLASRHGRLTCRHRGCDMRLRDALGRIIARGQAGGTDLAVILPVSPMAATRRSPDG